LSIQDAREKLEFAEAHPDIFDPVKVLDKGFVRLVDWYGTDSRIAEAARVSYKGGTKAVRNDAGLVDYLIRHSHTSPVEQVGVTFHIKAPIFVARQLFRHRTSSINEISARYSVVEEEFYVPAKARAQDSVNKQGSVFDERLSSPKMKAIVEEVDNISYSAYKSLLKEGVAREMARIVLPVNLYTEFYWNQNLHNLLHLIRLRVDEHAQWEIRQYAEEMYLTAKILFPGAVSSWENHTKNSVKLSGHEVEMLHETLTPDILEALLETVEKSDLPSGIKRETSEKFKALVK